MNFWNGAALKSKWPKWSLFLEINDGSIFLEGANCYHHHDKLCLLLICLNLSTPYCPFNARNDRIMWNINPTGVLLSTTGLNASSLFMPETSLALKEAVTFSIVKKHQNAQILKVAVLIDVKLDIVVLGLPIMEAWHIRTKEDTTTTTLLIVCFLRGIENFLLNL